MPSGTVFRFDLAVSVCSGMFEPTSNFVGRLLGGNAVQHSVPSAAINAHSDAHSDVHSDAHSDAHSE